MDQELSNLSFHHALRSQDVGLSKNRQEGWATGAHGRAYNFASMSASPGTAFPNQVEMPDW